MATLAQCGAHQTQGVRRYLLGQGLRGSGRRHPGNGDAARNGGTAPQDTCATSGGIKVSLIDEGWLVRVGDGYAATVINCRAVGTKVGGFLLRFVLAPEGDFVLLGVLHTDCAFAEGRSNPTLFLAAAGHGPVGDGFGHVEEVQLVFHGRNEGRQR